MQGQDNTTSLRIAMIMAAGYGNRMGQLTKTTPKPLLPLTEKMTIIDTVVAKLIRSGIERIVINCHYLGHKIHRHFASRQYEKTEIIFSDEPEILGSGGGIARAEPFFEGETILVTNADVLCEVDIQGLFHNHLREGALATMNLLPSKNSADYTLVKYDHTHQLQGFLPLNAAMPSGLSTGIFTGHQILSPETRQALKAVPMSVIDRVYKPGISEKKRILGSIFDGRWIDIGNRPFYDKLREEIRSGAFDIKPFMQ